MRTSTYSRALRPGGALGRLRPRRAPPHGQGCVVSRRRTHPLRRDGQRDRADLLVGRLAIFPKSSRQQTALARPHGAETVVLSVGKLALIPTFVCSAKDSWTSCTIPHVGARVPLAIVPSLHPYAIVLRIRPLACVTAWPIFWVTS